MKPADKHYKFINSETGYVIYYCSLSKDLCEKDAKAELEKTKAQVAVKNRIFIGTVYWQEIKEDQN